MKTKKHLLIGGFLGAIFVFLFSVNFVFAQTCSDPTDPASETGRCLSACDPATEHEISGTCMGQVCCATNPSSGLPIDNGANNNTDQCTKCLKGCEEQTVYGSADYYACSESCARLCGGSASQVTSITTLPNNSSSSVGSGGWSLGSISTFGLPGGSIMGIAVNILSWLLGLFGIIGILGFLISGIIYLTAAGDEERMAYAKRAMQYSIIGVIVGLVGFVVIQAIDYALNAYSLF